MRETDIRTDLVPVVGNWCYFVKCTRVATRKKNGVTQYYDGNLYLPDTYGERTNFAELIAVGPKCKTITEDRIGALFILPEWDNDMERITDEMFAARETVVLPVAFYP